MQNNSSPGQAICEPFLGSGTTLIAAQSCGRVMPQVGEARTTVSEIYVHALVRITELVSGTEGERLFLPGDPWFAADDEKQAVAYAGLITSSPASAAALIEACRAEATELLHRHQHVGLALAEQLQRERTMDGAAIDLCIAQAVAAKALADEHARRAEWARVEASARAFLADQKPQRGPLEPC